ncbi:unnamed protein product [Cylicocyclus nassatus]|nr:unnamed protein product [Cylicocyclus nassatus]
MDRGEDDSLETYSDAKTITSKFVRHQAFQTHQWEELEKTTEDLSQPQIVLNWTERIIQEGQKNFYSNLAFARAVALCNHRHTCFFEVHLTGTQPVTGQIKGAQFQNVPSEK